MDEFFHTYMASQEKIYVSESSIKKSIDYFNDDANKAVAMAALQCLAQSSPLPEGGLRVMKKPTQCVFATTDFVKGSLLLVPMAGFNNLRMKKTGDEAPRRGSEVTFDVDGAIGIVINPFSSSECTAPFWYVRGAREKKDANCKVVDKVIKYRMPSINAKCTMPLIDITIKCIENIRKIGAGDEVLIFRAAEAKTDREPAETFPRTEAKRQRRE